MLGMVSCSVVLVLMFFVRWCVDRLLCVVVRYSVLSVLLLKVGYVGCDVGMDMCVSMCLFVV